MNARRWDKYVAGTDCWSPPTRVACAPVATVTVRCQDGEGPYAKDTTVTLDASVDNGSPSKWSWQRDSTEVAGASDDTLEVTISDATAGAYQAVAVVDGKQVSSEPFEVKLMSDDGPPAASGPTSPDAPPEFYLRFAIVTGILALLVVVGVLLALGLLGDTLRLSPSEWSALTPNEMVATRIVIPITVLGAIAVTLGAWMAVVEWRGRFAKRAPKPKPEAEAKGVPDQIPAVIEAVGKLRGAALVMIVGALLLFAAAWITQSTADTATTPATTTTTTKPVR